MNIKCTKYVQNDIFAIKENNFVSRIVMKNEPFTPSKVERRTKVRPRIKTTFAKQKYKECQIWSHWYPTCSTLGINTTKAINPIPNHSIPTLTTLLFSKKPFNLWQPNTIPFLFSSSFFDALYSQYNKPIYIPII